MSIVIRWEASDPIHFDSQRESPNSAEIAKQIESISVFGQVFLDGIQNSQFEQWEPILTRWAGTCELDLRIINLDIETAVRWLNLGVRSLVVPETEYQAWSLELPVARLFFSSQAGGYERRTVREPEVQQTQIRPLVEPPTGGLPTHESWLVEAKDLAGNPEGVGDVVWKLLTSDRTDGLVPTLVVDPLGVALGLVYSSRESLILALKKRTGIYWSRSRNALWEKGATSGNRQHLCQIEMDCDRDALRFKVEPLADGFCHTGSYGCFGDDRSMSMIERHLASRLDGNDSHSITWKLANHPERLREKLVEEIDELLASTDSANADWEFADILYFALIALKSRGGKMKGALAELGRRSRRVTRRKPKGEIC